MPISQPERRSKAASNDANVIRVRRHRLQSPRASISGKKNGPPLAQGARRGVLTPSGIATGGGGAYPCCTTHAMASKALMSRVICLLKSRRIQGLVAGCKGARDSPFSLAQDLCSALQRINAPISMRPLPDVVHRCVTQFVWWSLLQCLEGRNEGLIHSVERDCACPRTLAELLIPEIQSDGNMRVTWHRIAQ